MIKKNKLTIFLITVIASAYLLFLLLNILFYNKIFPEYFPKEKLIQSFQNKVILQQSMGGFTVLDKGMLLSTNHDPQIYLPVNSIEYCNILTLKISKLNEKSSFAQIFYIKEGEHFSEDKSVRFTLRNGVNTIIIPYSNIVQIRLDLAEKPNVSFLLKEVILSNFIIMSSKFVLFYILLNLGVIIFIYLYIYKYKYIVTIQNNLRKIIFINNSIEHNKIEKLSDYFNHSKIYWICVILTSSLCYGFITTNLTVNQDNELFIFKDYPAMDALAQGRWGYYLLSFLPIDIFTFNFFGNSFINYFLHVIAVSFWVGLFKKYSNGIFNNIAGIIFSCISISLPYFAAHFLFFQIVLSSGFSQVFVCLCCYLLFQAFDDKKLKKNIYYFKFIICIILTTFIISIYEINMPRLLIGYFSILFLIQITSFETNKNKIKILFFRTLIIILICGISLVLWKVIGNIFLEMNDVKPYNYVLGSNFFVDTSNFSSFTKSLMNSFFGLISNMFKYNDIYTNNLIVTSRIIFLSCLIIYAIIYKNISVLLTGFILFLSSLSLEIISNNYSYLNRISIYTANFVGFAFSFSYLLLKNINIKIFKIKYVFNIKYILIIIYLYIILNSSLWINKIFYEQYLSYNYKLEVMRTISRDLLSFSKNKHVGFIGELPVLNQLDNRIYESIPYNYTTLYPMMRANLSIHAFFACHGNKLYGFNSESYYRVSKPYDFLNNVNIDDFISMPSYPEEGYIIENDEYIIIKLGILK